MGFRLDRTYALRWDAGDLEGLEVDVRSTSIATFNEIKGLSVNADEARVSELLIQHVKRWNLEDADGQPLPVTVEALQTQEPVLVRALAREWYLAAAGVSAPLDLGSTSSPSSAEESIPMETL